MRLRTLGFFCIGIAVLVSGCGGRQNASTAQSALLPQSTFALPAPLQTPALLAVKYPTGELEYWPIGPSRKMPILITRGLGLSQPSSMAANGTTVAITNTTPREVVLYDVASKKKTVLPDPFGVPTDIAINKKGTIFSLTIVKVGQVDVTMYKTGGKPKDFVCPVMSNIAWMAADNEGDIFLNGYGKFGIGVAEIPNGPNGLEANKCHALPIQPETGYVEGLAIDPKTDDLIVMNNPSACAGGTEGVMTIYPKPYSKNTGSSVVLGGNCPYGLRLNADSTMLFYSDSDVSGSFSFMQEAGYPGGSPIATYSGGQPIGFTTIPNTLPN